MLIIAVGLLLIIVGSLVLAISWNRKKNPGELEAGIIMLIFGVIIISLALTYGNF